MLNVLPDDPKIENLDPVTKLWMFYSWLEDLEEKHKFEKMYTILGGMFYNPEAAKQMYAAESGINSFESSDEDYQNSLKMVMEEDETDEDYKTDNKAGFTLHRRAKNIMRGK